MSRNNKKYCPKCNSFNTKKRGIENGIQSYSCKDCGRRFRNERKHKQFEENILWNEFVFHKQTVREIVERYGLNKKTVLKYLDDFEIKKKVNHRPRKIYLVIDATYFLKRKNGKSWGVILFRDAEEKEFVKIMDLAKSAKVVSSYNWIVDGDKKIGLEVSADRGWYITKADIKKNLLIKIGQLKKEITGYQNFKITDAYSGEVVGEISSFSGSVELYR